MLAWLRLSLRRLLDERAAALGLVALVLVTAFCSALAPRVLQRISDDSLRSQVAGAPSAERNLSLTRVYRQGERVPSPVTAIPEVGAQLEAQFPPVLRDLIEERRWYVETPSWSVQTGAPIASVLQLRMQEGALERIRIVEGTLPTGRVAGTPDDRPGVAPGLALPLFEAVMSAAAAERMGVGVGSTLKLGPDPIDPLSSNLDVGGAIRIVGTYELAEPDDPFWMEDLLVAAWRIRPVSAEVEFVATTVLLSPDAYQLFQTHTFNRGMPLRYGWRSFLDADALDAGRIDEITAAMRRLEGIFPASGAAASREGASQLRSGLLNLLERHEARWRSADAILAVVGVGAVAVAVATLGLVALISSTRRRRVYAMTRGRGASMPQILLAVLVEATLLTLPAVLVATLAAVALVPATAMTPTVVAAAGVAAVATVLLLAVVAAATNGPPREPGREPRIVRPVTQRRLVLEIVVVALAIGGAYLLRERGIGGGASGQGADPLIAAVPAFVGVAAGLVAVRLFPLLTAGLARLAAFGRGLVPVLAIRRQTRASSTAPVLLILLATATVGAFASATLAQLDRTAVLMGWSEVGAPTRIVAPAGSLPAGFDGGTLPGVVAAADAYETSVTPSSGGIRQLLVVDLAEHARILAGTPVDPVPPAAMLGPAPAEPLPAIVSAAVGGSGDRIRTGDEFTVRIGSHTVRLRAASVRTSFPSLPEESAFIVVAREQVAALHPTDPLRPTTSFLLTAPDAAPSLRQALAERAPSLAVVSRAERTAAVLGTPVVSAVTGGVAAAALAAILYAALAVAAALALAGAERRSEMAHLRTMGLSERQQAALIAVEYGPTVILAFVAGVALGFGLFGFLRPGLGLGAVIGSGLDVPVTVEALHLLLLLAAIGAIVAIGLGLGAALQRGAAMATAVRRGIE